MKDAGEWYAEKERKARELADQLRRAEQDFAAALGENREALAARIRKLRRDLEMARYVGD